MRHRSTVAALALCCVAAPLQAQVPVFDFRFGAHFNMPTGDLSDVYEPGFGIYGRVGAPFLALGPTKLMGTFAWNLFHETGPADDIDVLSVSVGPHFTMLPLVDFGVEAGYFTEFDELGVQPNVSMRLMRFDVTASYNTTFSGAAASWFTVGGGLRF